MKNFISPFQIFICAFVPFVAGAFIHDLSGSAGVAWIATLSFLAVSIVFLFRSLASHQQAQKVFLFFIVISLILSIVISCLALTLEGLNSFEAVQAFEISENGGSDLGVMGRASSQFKQLVEESGLVEALQFPWTIGCTYNNLLSPYKFGFALWSMPGIGYYSFAILAWWFNVIFYALALHIYSLSGDGQRKGFFLAGMMAWLLLPFALPYDREAIVVVPLCVLVLGVVSPYRLSALDWISIAFSFLLISIHRNAYAILVPFLVIIYVSYKFIADFLMKKFQTMSKRGALFLLIALLVASPLMSELCTFFGSFLSLNQDAVTQILDHTGGEQDTWQQFRMGIPVFDDLLKLCFLVLSPFPFYQMFKDGDGFALIVPPVLVSLNVLPVFMFGKLFVVVAVVRKILSGVTCYPILVLFSLMFLWPVLSSLRTGPAYLIPALAILVLWLLRNGLDTQFVKRSFVTYLLIICLTHFLFILVYRRL